MDTRLLRTFAALARTGSFTAAAAELHLAQSTVTVQVRTLERELGTRLFDRLPTGAVPTSAGRRLLTEAEDVLDAEARLRAAAAGRRRGPTAPWRGRSSSARASPCAPPGCPGVIASLRPHPPGHRLNLHPAGSAAAIEGLRAGRLDLALLLEQRGRPRRPDRARPSPANRSSISPPPTTRCAGRAARAGRSWPGELLRPRGGLLVQRPAGAHPARTLPGPPPRLTRFGSIEAARSCVAAGLGLTLLPRATVERQLAEGTPGRGRRPPIPPVPVQLTRHRRRWTSPAARAGRRRADASGSA